MASNSMDHIPDQVMAKILLYEKIDDRRRNVLSTVSPRFRKVLSKYHGVHMATGSKNGILIEAIESGDSRLQTWPRYQSTQTPVTLEEEIISLTLEKERLTSQIEALKAESAGTTDTNTTTNLNGNDNGEIVPSQTQMDVDVGTSPQEFGDSNVPQQQGQSKELTFEELTSKLNYPPDSVHKLSFVGLHLPISVPVSLISICKNLEGLHFHLSSLALINPILPLTMDIPTLKTFVLDSFGMKIEKGSLKKFMDLPLRNIFSVAEAILEQNNFPHLKTFIVDIPFCPEKEKVVVTRVSKFLERHHDSIESFCYSQGFYMRLPPPPQETDPRDSINQDEDMDEDDDGEEMLSLKELGVLSTGLKKVSLKHLHIGLHSEQDTAPLWKNLLLSQRHSEKVIFTGDSIPFPGVTLKANELMTTLVLELRDNVDLKGLSGCKKLKKLELFGRPKDENALNEDAFEGEANISNLMELSDSLETLKIHFLHVKSKEIKELVFSNKFKRLRGLELISCGVEGALGVPLEVVGKIFDDKKLDWFRIKECLNRQSILSRKLPSSLKLLGLTLQSNSISQCTIQGYLNPFGRYNPDPIVHKVDLREFDVFEFPEAIYPVGALKKGDKDEEDTESEGSMEDSSYEDVSDEDTDMEPEVPTAS